MWVADFFRAPGRLRRLEAETKRESLARDPYRPSIAANGIRWVRSNVGASNEAHCELCFQERDVLIPLRLFAEGDDKDQPGVVVWRCFHQSHSGHYPVFELSVAENNLRRAMVIPDRSASA